jgi:hypothetical protein
VSSDVQEIEQVIRSLPRPKVEQLREWIENFLEDQFELTDEFNASIERGNEMSPGGACARNDEIHRLTPLTPSSEERESQSAPFFVFQKLQKSIVNVRRSASLVLFSRARPFE